MSKVYFDIGKYDVYTIADDLYDSGSNWVGAITYNYINIDGNVYQIKRFRYVINQTAFVVFEFNKNIYSEEEMYIIMNGDKETSDFVFKCDLVVDNLVVCSYIVDFNDETNINLQIESANIKLEDGYGVDCF